MFRIHREGWQLKYLRKKASTDFSPNTVVAEGASGVIEPGDSSDSALVGICMAEVSSTDDDYADNSRIPVLVPKEKGAQMLADVTTGSISLSDEGSTFDLDDESGVDQGSTSNNAVKLQQFVASDEGIFTIETPEYA